jgi:hypothetical protein
MSAVTTALSLPACIFTDCHFFPDSDDLCPELSTTPKCEASPSLEKEDKEKLLQQRKAEAQIRRRKKKKTNSSLAATTFKVSQLVGAGTAKDKGVECGWRTPKSGQSFQNQGCIHNTSFSPSKLSYIKQGWKGLPDTNTIALCPFVKLVGAGKAKEIECGCMDCGEPQSLGRVFNNRGCIHNTSFSPS